MPQPWRPLLRSARAEAALSAVEGIAADLRAWPEDQIDDPSLFFGHAGLAVFFSYLAKSPVGDAESDRRRAFRHLELALQTWSRQPQDLSFANGFAGLAWAMAHLQSRDGGAGAARSDSRVEAILARAIQHETWGGTPGLFEGLAGIGISLLERLPQPGARAALEQLAERLRSLAQESGPGVAWWTPTLVADGGHGMERLAGEFNLGVAHGTPGVIGVLGMLAGSSIGRPEIEPLLRPAIDWVFDQTMEDADGFRGFPYSVRPGVDPIPARQAWCYGTPGIAAALNCAAEGLGDAALGVRAREVAHMGAGGGDAGTGIRDACLCHGAAGLAHIYNRLSQATGDRDLQRAALHWYDRTMAMRLAGEPIGGFKGYGRDDAGEERLFPCVDLLNGSAGIGLALLAAATPMAPDWDRCLAMSVGSPVPAVTRPQYALSP